MTTSSANREAIIASAQRHALERETFFQNVSYNFNAHNKHIVNHPYYDGRRSVWEHKDPESLLKKFAGTGRPERGVPGNIGYKEVVDFKERIGIFKDKEGVIALPTTRGTIHYGKKGAHIVPAHPNPVSKHIPK